MKWTELSHRFGAAGVVQLVALVLTLTHPSARAASATWKSNPVSGDWNTAANWTPATVPNGPTDVATFASSSQTAVSLSANTEVGEIVFSAGASSFTISASPGVTFSISGAGITNTSSVVQNFVASAGPTSRGYLFFLGSATAGDLVNITSQGTMGLEFAGETVFDENSNAGSAVFITEAALSEGFGGGYGAVVFEGTASAANGTFITYGGAFSEAGAEVLFIRNATAADATFITNPGTARGGQGGFVSVGEVTNSAGSATFISNGATVAGAFGGVTSVAGQPDNCTLLADGGSGGGTGGEVLLIGSVFVPGGNERIKLSGNGSFYFGAGFTQDRESIGSLEGHGSVYPASIPLAVGSNNLSTIFRGVVRNDGQGGSLEKVGSGTLTLTNSNEYPGGTSVKQGKLVINNTLGSGTGSGPVVVNGGALGGTGIIAGAVTIGNSGRSALLTPGSSENLFATLTIKSNLAILSGATLHVRVNSDNASAGAVTVSGVTISDAQFSLRDDGSSVLAVGTVIVPVNNTAAAPISGTFSNLPDGGVITVGSNTFQANYEGGDGNDLTLTVVP
ncbi:MAG: autotransporter-associated beta strand repeat-containing protein [Chthoniobacterales bacterium]|nr:autotransporter-associated beta strand repeat-containing protein [Chthoniobacterales bacterium]